MTKLTDKNNNLVKRDQQSIYKAVNATGMVKALDSRRVAWFIQKDVLGLFKVTVSSNLCDSYPPNKAINVFLRMVVLMCDD